MIRCLALPAFVLLLSAPVVASQTIQVSRDNRTVAVNVTDEAEIEADLAIVSIGFEVFGSDQAQTYADGTRISNAIIDALRTAGVNADAIQSQSQNLSAISDDDKVRYAKGIRFHFAQGWSVTVPASSAAATLHVAILAGANESGGIQWKLKDDTALDAAAADKALMHARQLADKMARGLGSKLGPVVYTSNQAPVRGPFATFLNSEQASVAVERKANLKPLAIAPERLSRSATVYAIFALE